MSNRHAPASFQDQSGAGATAGSAHAGQPCDQAAGEALGTDKNAAQGQNMEATGAGGTQLPATQHQQDVMQKPGTGEEPQKQPGR